MRVTIIFQAFIPGSLGKPLKNYFANHMLNRHAILKNYATFNNKLNSVSGKWLPEPGSFSKYYQTDNREFGQPGTYRLRSIGSIDLSRIGKYSTKTTVFTHDCTDSHQVLAKISNLNFAGPESIQAPEWYGIFRKSPPQKGSPDQNTDSIRNTLLGTYISAPGTKVPFDGTIFTTKASAGYPYAEPFSPNIDYSLVIAIQKTPTYCHFTVTGSHNLFPCYELYIGPTLVYQYDAVANGETGPGLINLNRSTDFSVRHTKMVSNNAGPSFHGGSQYGRLIDRRIAFD